VSSPSVSVILPTQGERSTIARALRSALEQTHDSFEVVVVDDAVANTGWVHDPTVARALSDPRVRLVPWRQSRGCAAAKNAGLRAARGEWVCYLDDDNEYLAGKVRAQHELAVSSGSPMVLCGLEMRVRHRRRRRQIDAGGFSGDDLLLRAVPDTNVLFHRPGPDCWWDESLGTVDDACFFQALLARHRLSRVPNVATALVVYHVHTGQRANLGFERFYRGQRCLLTRWARPYSRHARRVLLLRSLIAFAKYREGGWGRLAHCGWALLRTGGWREWRVIANACGVKVPSVRRWMVT